MITVIQLILILIACCPNHELNQDPVLRDEVAGYFEAAGDQYSIPPTLLVYQAEEESSLRHTAIGDRGEVGYCQAHGKARKTCEAAGYDPTTRRGGIYCMALLLDMGRRKCGGMVRGFGWYMSGFCHKANEKAKRRLQVWKRKAGVK